MQRLADRESWTGVKYDINNLSDYSAIPGEFRHHVSQLKRQHLLLATVLNP